MMAFYFDDPEATRSTIINGWLHTGDIGYQCGGKWYITDRVKVSQIFTSVSISRR